MSCDDIDDIQQYLKSVIQSEFIPYIPSRPRTLLSIISDCLHDEFDEYTYVGYSDKMYVVYTMWIAIRTLMTNSDKNISFFTLADNDKKYKDITPKFIDWNQYYDYKDYALMLCDKIYYLCKAYNIDIPCGDDGDIPIDFMECQ